METFRRYVSRLLALAAAGVLTKACIQAAQSGMGALTHLLELNVPFAIADMRDTFLLVTVALAIGICAILIDPRPATNRYKIVRHKIVHDAQ